MIHLTRDFVLTADDHCYIVGRPRQRAGRAPTIDGPAYYATVGQAVQGALCRAMRVSVKEDGVTTLREFVERQEQLLAELQRLIAPLDTGNSRQSPAEGAAPPAEGSDTPEKERSQNP